MRKVYCLETQELKNQKVNVKQLDWSGWKESAHLGVCSKPY